MIETTSVSVPDLIAVLRRSSLVDDERLKKALQGVDLQRVQAEDITHLLSEAKLLTPWQCRQLLKGRYKGYRLGKYLLLSELGRGGMAKVFLARHETLLNLVAIKVLARERLAKPSMIHRFLREARAAAQISHPNIVRVFDVDADDDRNYLVMEYVRGRSVQDMVDDDGPLPFDKAVRFTYEAALGLAVAHKHGLVHRDVKPANLLVEDDKLVKLSDFGLARAGGEEEDDTPSLTMQHDEKVLGTADYIAPEQAINSHAIDARADLYSLGYTLYFMLTGQPPFPTGRIVERLTKHCTQEPEAIRAFRPNAPDSLLNIVHKLTRKNAEERYASAEAAAEALAGWLAQAAGMPRTADILPVNRPRPTLAHSSTTRLSASSSLNGEELSLAPEDDEAAKKPPTVAAKKTIPHQGASTVKQGVAEHELPQLDGDALLDDEPLGANLGNFAELFDEILIRDPAAAVSTGKQLGKTGQTSDVHGSDVQSQGASPSRVDTTTSRAMPTAFKKKEAPRPSALARLKASMARGEYPLWLLIGAGLILGVIAMMIALNYSRSNTPVELPSYRRLEQ